MKSPQEQAEQTWNEFASIFKGLDKKDVYVFTKKAALIHVNFLMKCDYKGGDGYNYFKQVKKCINLM